MVTTTCQQKTIYKMKGSQKGTVDSHGFRLLDGIGGGLSGNSSVGAYGSSSSCNPTGNGSVNGSGGGGGGGGSVTVGDRCDTGSTISRNSIYKTKIDSMFDDSRSILSHHFDDRLSSSHRPILPYENSISQLRESTRTVSSIGGGHHQYRSHRRDGGREDDDDDDDRDVGSSDPDTIENINDIEKDEINNTIQAQIEKMFTDVVKDVHSCSFPVRCLGSLPLKEKVTSLHGLQEPLRQLYLSGAGHGNQTEGNLDLFAKGLRVRLSNGQVTDITPFHNIAVWSAVKFVVSLPDGGAAFLPLITDAENVDKHSLFIPLSAADKRRLSSGVHAPIFAVVMRSSGTCRQLECHAFVCQTPEDAIILAATLYESLMAHMGNRQNKNSNKPRNQNGVSCISIASSSGGNGGGGGGGGGGDNGLLTNHEKGSLNRQEYPKPIDERKKKSIKNRKAPPVPTAFVDQNKQYRSSSSRNENSSTHQLMKNISPLNHNNNNTVTSAASTTITTTNYQSTTIEHCGGDILTRVAIPRSGSFLNTSGLTKYKSRATRRTAGKNYSGGGIFIKSNRSPLGFSELFNEFRLQENLHSLDDILNTIINFDGMSFNDLKPIYKEFLLKLAVTLTKDELYQRSKSIMKRQKKRKLRKRCVSQGKKQHSMFGSKGLNKVYWFGKHHINKLKKFKLTMKSSSKTTNKKKHHHQQQKNSNRNRAGGTSSSDVSIHRNELITSAQNRNSSSGYVSCSECSYDSEACTFTSADRCYCSLGADHDDDDGGGGNGGGGNPNKKINSNVRRRRKHNHQNGESNNNNNNNHKPNGSSTVEDQCYCSISEGNDYASSATTFCDSDSCTSNTKCYCKSKKESNSSTIIGRPAEYITDNLALDYELFTVDGIAGKHLRPNEALSVKKSVEMAALFADVKLSQTTDIQNFIRTKPTKTMSISSSSIRSKCHNNNSSRHASIRSNIGINGGGCGTSSTTGGIDAVGATLEDSLGYLP